MNTRNLLSGPITLSDARGRSTNVLQSLLYPQRKLAFYSYIEGHRALLTDLVAHHLGAEPANVSISSQEWWRHGSFNLCVPLKVDADHARPNVPEYAIIRFPLPYRVGEATNPGNSDEKLSCEAATYAWIEDNCPSVPIPKLFGFGLSTNQRFTNASLLPWWSRWWHQARCLLLATFGLEQPSQYVSHSSSDFASLGIGYLLIESITLERGDMLSESWDEKRDEARMQNLQGDLAKIMVTLARIPLPRIGSFRLDHGGYLRLDNRPLSVESTMHENEGLSPSTSRRTTFSNVKDFVLSQVTAFETRLLEQPNAIESNGDAWYQMTGLIAAKLALPQLLRDDLSNGPFGFALTDLHRSNIFVDDNWNITGIIDLEFACSWPLEFIRTPHWLEVEFIDNVTPTDFAPRHTEFMEHIKREEELQLCNNPDTEPLSSIMQRSWDSGTFWVSLTVMDPISFAAIFFQRVLKGYFYFPSDELDNGAYSRFCSRLFRRDVQKLIDRKLDDRDRYMEQLTEAFTDAPAG